MFTRHRARFQAQDIEPPCPQPTTYSRVSVFPCDMSTDLCVTMHRAFTCLCLGLCSHSLVPMNWAQRYCDFPLPFLHPYVPSEPKRKFRKQSSVQFINVTCVFYICTLDRALRRKSRPLFPLSRGFASRFRCILYNRFQYGE